MVNHNFSPLESALGPRLLWRPLIKIVTYNFPEDNVSFKSNSLALVFKLELLGDFVNKHSLERIQIWRASEKK